MAGTVAGERVAVEAVRRIKPGDRPALAGASGNAAVNGIDPANGLDLPLSGRAGSRPAGGGGTLWPRCAASGGGSGGGGYGCAAAG